MPKARSVRGKKNPSEPEKLQPSLPHSPQETVLLVGGIILLMLLVYNIIPVISPFVIVGAILFLLYPLRHLPLTRTVMWLAVLLFSLWFLYSLAGILAPFIISFLLAYLFNPLIRKAEAWNIARWLSSLTVILALLSVMALIATFTMPIAFKQFEGFLEGISGLVNDVMDLIKHGAFVATLNKYGFPVERLKELLSQDLTPRLETIVRGLLEGAFDLLSGVSALVTHIINIVIIPFLAFYFMKDFPSVIERFERFVPEARRAGVEEYFTKVDRLFGRYLRGALAVAFIHGVLVSLFLWVFGIRYSLVLGIVAGVLSIIPYFGLFVSLGLSILVALFSGEPAWLKVIFVLITFGVLQILEFAVISPNILGKQIGLHPVVLVLSLLVFGYFLGFVGLLVAVPTTAILTMSFQEWEKRRASMRTASINA